MNFIELHCVIEYHATLLCFEIITTATFSNLQNVLLYLSVCFAVFKYFKRIYCLKMLWKVFLESFPDNKSLRHQLHWWYDRRRNIFHAFIAIIIRGLTRLM